MRIVHWYPNFLAGGGVANSVLGLANAQAAAGADVWIASLSQGDSIYGPLRPGPGVRIATWDFGHSIRGGILRLHVMKRGQAPALRGLKPDVVHLHGEFNPDNWWVPRLWTCPLVLSPHGAFHSTVMQRGAWRKRLYIAATRRALYGKVGRFHVLSPAEQADLAAALPRARTYYVPQGPSPAVQETLAAEAPAKPGNGPIRFTFVGRIDPQVKGLDVLVKAFARAMRDRVTTTPAALELVGPDWRNGAASLRDLARDLGVEEIIEIRGPISASEVAEVLESCDVYVQLSRNEGSPLSLNDALALGKPAIVSNRVGTISCEEIARLPHVRVVTPSVSGAAQAIVEALDDLDGLLRQAREAHAGLSDFLSWERAARRHLEEYASLLPA